MKSSKSLLAKNIQTFQARDLDKIPSTKLITPSMRRLKLFFKSILWTVLFEIYGHHDHPPQETFSAQHPQADFLFDAGALRCRGQNRRVQLFRPRWYVPRRLGGFGDVVLGLHQIEKGLELGQSSRLSIGIRGTTLSSRRQCFRASNNFL